MRCLTTISSASNVERSALARSEAVDVGVSQSSQYCRGLPRIAVVVSK